MRIEERLRAERPTERANVTPPEEAWDSIRRRLDRGPRDGARRVAAAVTALVLAVAAIAVVVGAFGRRSVGPAGVWSNGDILFTRLVSKGAHGMDDTALYSVRPDGSGLTRLTTGPGAVEEVAVSADGRRIAYVLQRESPAPDATGRQTQDAVYVIDRPGAIPRLLVQCHDLCANPAWSPDGRQIAFADEASAYQGSDIEVVPADGGPVRTLCAVACGQGLSEPSWSPDGSRIAFSQLGVLVRMGLGIPPGSLWVVNADGSSLERITGATTCGSGRTCFLDVAPAWSPDGSTIAFDRIRASFGPHARGVAGIYLLPVGGEARLLWRCSSPYSCQSSAPQWSPDGSRLAFGTDGGPDVTVIAPDGSHERTISLCSTPDCTLVSNVVWSPDGDRLAVTAFHGIGKQSDMIPQGLYLMGADGTGLHEVVSGQIGDVAWVPGG